MSPRTQTSPCTAAPLQFHGGRKDLATNATLLVDVLSPSTEAYDRGEKFETYKKVPTLQEYVLVSSDQAVVEVYTRAAPRVWKPMMYRGLEGQVALASLEVSLPMKEIFDGVSVPA